MCVDPTATVLYSEIYMGGRKYYGGGELFNFDILSVCSHGERPDGEQLFREKFIIRPDEGHIRDCGVMGKYDIFANVIVMTPADKAEMIYQQTRAYIDPSRQLAAGITHLPNGAGLLFKVLGKEPGPVKAAVREFASNVRMAIKGVTLPEEFPWR
jgi:urease accessory protein